MLYKRILFLMLLTGCCLLPVVRAQDAAADENVVIDATAESVVEAPAEESGDAPAAEAVPEAEETAAADGEAVEEIAAEPVDEVVIEEAVDEPAMKEMTPDQKLGIYLRKLYDAGRYADALEICELMLKDYPDDRKLLDLKGQILIAQRQLDVLKRYVDTDQALNAVLQNSLNPEKPLDVDRPESSQIIELVSGMNREQRANVRVQLEQRISLNVVDAPLSYVLNLLFRGTGINIIADQKVMAGKKLTIQVEKIPLEGVLNYISRMEGITYSISHETVWITTADKPMHETRIIRLRTGLTDVLERLSLDEGTSTPNNKGRAPAKASAPTSDMEKVLDRIAEIIEWPKGSNWVLDRKTNSLFVRSTSDALDKFEKIVAAVDIAPLQVLIEAKFVEISDGDLKDVGVEWQVAANSRIQGLGGGRDGIDLNAGSGTNFTFPAREGGVTDFTNNVTGMDLFLTGVLTSPQFDAVIHAVDSKDSSHTLSSPTLLTMNNFEGTIKVTTDLVYIESYSVDRYKGNISATTGLNVNYFTIGDDDGDGDINEDSVDGIDNDLDGDIDEDGLPGELAANSANNVGSEPVIIPVFASDFEGVVLKVLPSIGLDGKIITLTLQPEVTEMVGQETFNLVIPNYSGTAEIKRPIMNRRTFATKLSIEDGSTVVLGGLKREKNVRMVSRVPVLGNIPILGRLFSRSYVEKVSTNLLIFVTAHILEPSGSMYKQEGDLQKTVSIETPDGRKISAEELDAIIKEKKNRD